MIGSASTSATPAGKRFTVKVGTIFEDSHVQMRDWLVAIHLICSSKKGFSANRLHRTLGVTLKTAWFIGHRVREAMRVGGLAPMGGEGSVVEMDETFIGRKPGVEARPGWVRHKHAVLTLVERGGAVRSFHIDSATKENIVPIVNANLDRESHLMTDEARRYEAIGKEFASHGVVNHSREEYGYTDRVTGMKVNTNTVDFQARHEGRLPALQRKAPASLSCRIRFPLFEPCEARS
jgi:hypothetical protein